MCLIKGIHHVEMMTGEFSAMCDYFMHSLGYSMVATGEKGPTHSVVFKQGESLFLIKNADHYYPFSHGNYCEDKIIDTVYNIALEVSNVEECMERVSDIGGLVAVPVTVLSDSHGKVTIATIHSCVGNVLHTLVDSSLYNGPFLPGFISHSGSHQQNYKSQNGHSNGKVNGLNGVHKSHPQHVTHADHVTFAVYQGQTNEVMKWYSQAFDMKRCLINKEESDLDGFVVQHNLNGLKLKAFDYWRCAEASLTTSERAASTFKFVVAEPLHESVPNQITVFLKSHGGPGIQHIGLHVNSIVDTARDMIASGVTFLVPPAAYYEEPAKMQELISLGLNPLALREVGILLDVEEVDDEGQEPGYLLQTFTRPVFKRDTFFFELIERRGAQGFGAGNIKALWRAVDFYMKMSVQNKSD